MSGTLSDVAVIGFNHKSACVEKRELFSIHSDKFPELYQTLKERKIDEVVYLATCNRVETYIASTSIRDSVENLLHYYEEVSGLPYEEFKDSIYIKYSHEAVRHILTVISSLDSMVLGETEIVSQMKDAFTHAVYNKSVGPVLNKLFHQAFKTAKQVRSETEISKNPLSIAFIATDLARNIYPDLSDKKALLIGAGQMGELILKYLTKYGVGDIVIANRSLHNAERIADEINRDAKVILLDEIMDIATDVDIVVTSVSAPHYMITAEMVKEALSEREGVPLILIDIAVPRNIDPNVGDLEGVYLYNIDSLQEIANDNLKSRLSEARLAQEYIEQNVKEFIEWFSELSLTPTISNIQNKFDEIRCKEVERYRRKKLKHLSDEDFQLVEDLTRQIMTKTLHNPIMNLKRQHRCSDDVHMDEELFRRKTKFIEELFIER